MAPRIAIVGGGFSGTALAVQLLQRRPECEVVLIERSGRFGQGLAYSTDCDAHVLNVRAERMSALRDHPDHFTRWLAETGRDADPDRFIQRREYGRYVADWLAEAEREAPARLTRVEAEVVNLSRDAGGWTLALADGTALAADAVALALGNFAPLTPEVEGLDSTTPAYVADPWAPGALDGLAPDTDVLLVGAGLTMVDVLLKLERSGWRGHALAVSRHGLLPHSHDARQIHVHAPPPPQARLSAALRDFRRRAAERPWGELMDELRPHVQALWTRLSETERSRFLRHLRPWWDVHRHRLAPEVAAHVEELLAAGRLEVAAGRLAKVSAGECRLTVEWRPRGEHDLRRSSVDLMVNCTGPAFDLTRARDPLVDALLAAGLVRSDRLKTGFDVDLNGRPLDAAGRPTPGLYAVGPLTRAAFWEIVAVPDIRTQAAALADLMVVPPVPVEG
ncbi:FAD/NAD(P)-binding protein [Caulobacter sp. 17J80-11]|uniref:FAD/NAD(P)-binding protein n=1 Tax=Caulobacter sp. 17J80-11 TaxID=2763502 RepID=UPI0016537EA0|nr:FAD/NAD(P)-binding protein [Caulobacter sp. 17J80-11]MBC6982845.1 FAD/NAD(P)-binding protein [Caulobacter sp. 17J80-11]